MLVRNGSIHIMLTPRHSCICLLLCEGWLCSLSLLPLIWGDLGCLADSRDELSVAACQAPFCGCPRRVGLEGWGLHGSDASIDWDDHGSALGRALDMRSGNLYTAGATTSVKSANRGAAGALYAILLLPRQPQFVSMSQIRAVCSTWLFSDDVVMFDKNGGVCWTFDPSSEIAMGYVSNMQWYR